MHMGCGQVADVLQCTVSSEADHILAAVFLNKFVHDQTSWIHFDLAPAVKPGILHPLRLACSACLRDNASANALCTEQDLCCGHKALFRLYGKHRLRGSQNGPSASCGSSVLWLKLTG